MEEEGGEMLIGKVQKLIGWMMGVDDRVLLFALIVLVALMFVFCMVWMVAMERSNEELERLVESFLSDKNDFDKQIQK